jgi:hypothetical protein
MDDQTLNTPGSCPERMENARTGYETAVNYSILNQNIIWSIFNTMLVANSIVVAGIGLIHEIPNYHGFFHIFLPGIGIGLCLIWFVIFRRHFKLSLYFLFSARELEEQYLNDPLVTFHRGEAFSGGAKVSFIGKEKPLGMNFIEKMKGNYSLCVIIGIFMLFYVGAFFI